MKYIRYYKLIIFDTIYKKKKFYIKILEKNFLFLKNSIFRYSRNFINLDNNSDIELDNEFYIEIIIFENFNKNNKILGNNNLDNRFNQ